MNCPVQGMCQEKGIIYQADVKVEEEETKTYIGAAATTFKLRYANHKKSLKNRVYEFDTEISKYIWELADKNKTYSIQWKILRRAQPYNPASERCDLCATEKTIIANFKNKNQLLNTRNELMAKCRHREKWLLCNWKSRGKTKAQGRKKTVQEKPNQIQEITPPTQLVTINKPGRKTQKNPQKDAASINLPKRTRKSTKRDDHIY